MMSLLQKGNSLSKKDSRFDKCYTYFIDMRKNVSLILLLLLTLACALPSASPVVELPQQPVDVNALETIIVQTAEAAQTQTAFANPSFTPTYTSTPTRVPSITPTPTVTFIYLLPTLTPIPTITPIGFIPSGGGASGTSVFKTPVPWSCEVIVSQTQPPKWAVIEKKSEFYAFWTIRNTGSKTWTRTTIDLVYTGGYRHEGTKIQDTKETVPPGSTLRVSAFFIAPKAAGEYRSFFALQVGNRQYCGMKIEFVVKD
jgi:hypothetical protein